LAHVPITQLEERTMSGDTRFTPVDPDNTTAVNTAVFKTIRDEFSMVPNSFRVMANSEALLGGYWGLDHALAQGVLPHATRNEIALAVSELNRCPYCLSAFTAVGQAIGISAHEIEQCRLAHSDDPKVDAALQFAKAIVKDRGAVSDQDFARVRAAGYSDTEIMEIVANVALITAANYINLVAQTEVDFPLVRPGEAASS